MFELINVNWKELFVPSASLMELFIRGTIIYIALFSMLRFTLKRERTGLNITDMLFIVLIADAAQNGMAGEYKSITEGVFVVGTILFWNYFIDWIAYRSKLLESIIYPPPLKIVENGRLLRQNMRSELLTEEGIMGALREQNIEHLSRVKEAFMERNGNISFVTENDKSP